MKIAWICTYNRGSTESTRVAVHFGTCNDFEIIEKELLQRDMEAVRTGGMKRIGDSTTLPKSHIYTSVGQQVVKECFH